MPFPPEDPQQRATYSAVERLCELLLPAPAQGEDVQANFLAHDCFEQLFFDGPDALLPQLQAGFFVNQFAVSVKVAARSTGVHGLKYSDVGKGPTQSYNSLSAQFMPRAIRCAETGVEVPITELKKGRMRQDVKFTTAIRPYIVASSSARGT